MKVSVVIDTGRPWSAVPELARQVGEQGVHAVSVADHFMEHTDDGSPSVLAPPYREAGVDEFVLLPRRSRPATETQQIVEAALESSLSDTPGWAGLQP